MATPDQGFRDLRGASRREPSEEPGPRGRQRRSLWWVHHGIERLGPGLVIAFLGVVVIAVSLVSLRVFYFKPDQAPLAEAAPLFDGDPSPNYGRPLSPAVRLRLARFGIPLHMGPNGVPLIRERDTGEVREVTVVEMALPETGEAVPSADNPDVLTAPGPHGTTVQWWSPAHLRDLPEFQPVDRVRWYQLHEDRLNGLVRDLVLALEFVARTPVDHWDDRWGRELVAISVAITDKYAYGNPEYWLFTSRTIHCDLGLELAMTQGVGGSCPSEDFSRALDQVYVAGGEIVGRLRRVGLAAQLPYDHRTGAMYSDTAVSSYQEESLVEVQRLMSDMVVLFEDLRLYGEAHGHYLNVQLP